MPPEPSSQSDEVVVLHFLDGDETAVMRRSGIQGPSLLLHMLVSSLSALAMLALTCSLRYQAMTRVRVRPSVAIARPVLQVYGVLPGSESQADSTELSGLVDGSEEQPTGQAADPRDAMPTEEHRNASMPQVETIQVEVIRQPADWTSCVAVPINPGVAVGQRLSSPIAVEPNPPRPTSPLAPAAETQT